MILGIDAWSGYGAIDWARAKAAGVQFAWLKCTQGNDGKDPKFDAYAQGCRDTGVAAGPYLFAYPLPSTKPGRAPEDQARALYHDCNGLGTQPGDLPPALDLEWPPHFEKDKGTSKILDRWTQWNVDAAFIASWALACLTEIERLFKRTPVLYTYPNFWQSLGEAGKNPAFAKYPLWIANYTAPKDWLPSGKPAVPAPWSDWTAWQFSADGSSIRIPGVPACPLDRNVVKDLSSLTRIDRQVSEATFDIVDDVVTRP